MNLYLRKDGRYESRVPNGKKPDGKRAFLYVLARTKEQCIERVQAIHRQHRPQGYCALTGAELFSEWHRSILHRVKESTAANYTMKADKHILPAFGTMAVSTLTADSIYGFIAEKQNAGFSPRYIADIVILKIPELAMPASQRVTTNNGKREVWTDYEKAKAYFLELMMSTEGEEHERAECIYIQLLHGLGECSDD